MIKAVLDTNVLISGFISPHGAPAKIITEWRKKRFELVLSPAAGTATAISAAAAARTGCTSFSLSKVQKAREALAYLPSTFGAADFVFVF